MTTIVHMLSGSNSRKQDRYVTGEAREMTGSLSFILIVFACQDNHKLWAYELLSCPDSGQYSYNCQSAMQLIDPSLRGLLGICIKSKPGKPPIQVPSIMASCSARLWLASQASAEVLDLFKWCQ